MTSRKLLVPAIALLFLTALAGCQEREGPAEKAGKELDKAAAAVGDSMEKAGEKIQGALSPGK